MVSNEFSSTYTSSPNPPKNDSITVPSRVKNSNECESESETLVLFFPQYSNSPSNWFSLTFKSIHKRATAL